MHGRRATRSRLRGRSQYKPTELCRQVVAHAGWLLCFQGSFEEMMFAVLHEPVFPLIAALLVGVGGEVPRERRIDAP